MEKFKGFIFIIGILFACVFVCTVGYWFGNRSGNELRNEAVKLQSSLKESVQREQSAINSLNDIKNKLNESNKYIEQLQAQNRQLTDAINSIKSDSSKLITTEQFIDTGLAEAIRRIEQQQKQLANYSD